MTDRRFRAWAPGRVNLIGEHTDYNDGLVLPMAIDRGVEAQVSPRRDSLVTVMSRQRPDDVVEAEVLEPGSVVGWSAYVLGAVWALAEASGFGGGLDIVVDGNVPLGAGLSSSAALECAVVLAVAAAWQRDLEPRDVARLAQRAENAFVGVPTGSMDQVASVMSRAGSALLFDVRDDTVEHVRLDRLLRDSAFLVIDTRAAHELVDGGYASRRRQCEQAAELLGVPSLREVSSLEAAISALDGAPEVLVRRLRHVVTENDRVARSGGAIAAGDVEAFGSLMLESHASLRDDFEVSCIELDVSVEVAREAGAHGARMTGGGFGGSSIALVPVRRLEYVGDRIREAYADRQWPEPHLWPVAPAAGARVLFP